MFCGRLHAGAWDEEVCCLRVCGVDERGARAALVHRSTGPRRRSRQQVCEFRRHANETAHKPAGTHAHGCIPSHACRASGPDRCARKMTAPRRASEAADGALEAREAARALITLRHGPAALFNASSRRCSPSSCSSASFYSSRNATACWANTDVTFPASCSCTVEECEFVVAVLARER